MLDRGENNPLIQCPICKESVDYWEPYKLDENNLPQHMTCLLTPEEIKVIIDDENTSEGQRRYYQYFLNPLSLDY